jgi:hypothetical protein
MAIILWIAILFSSGIARTEAQEPNTISQSSTRVKSDIRIVSDILFIAQTISESHPGAVNQADPQFIATLKSAEGKALKDVVYTNADGKHKQVLQEFVQAFNDKHMYITWNAQAQTSQPAPCSVKVVNDIPWITIPTFISTKETQQAFNDLIKQLPAMRTKRSIVFDVHGNGGGDSSWGTRIVEALFSQEFAQPRITALHQQELVEWRVSKDNAAHVALLLEQIQSQGNYDSSEIQLVEQLLHGMQQALGSGQNFVTEPTLQQFDDKVCADGPYIVSPVQVIVLINKACGSATLDFLDELKAAYPTVILIGQETSADTNYMEVRSVPLPSGLGSFTFPMKIYRNRQRKSGETYVPDYVYVGDMHGKDFQDFVLWISAGGDHGSVAEPHLLAPHSPDLS